MAGNLLKNNVVKHWPRNDILFVSSAKKSTIRTMPLGRSLLKEVAVAFTKTTLLQFLNGGVVCSENLALALPIKSCVSELLPKSLQLVKDANLLK